MRLVATIAVLLLGACSFDTRSPQFACDTEADCPSGRSCDDGWCVTTATPDADPSAPDADPSAPDADTGECPDQCTSCAGTVCTIECNTEGACSAPITCPSGWSCEVQCTGTDSCAGGVTCSDDACTVTCSGPSSCAGGVDCSNACACDTDCSGSGACSTEPICPANPCDKGLDCTSEPGPCNSC